jgi:LacI family transcriptional regulator
MTQREVNPSVTLEDVAARAGVSVSTASRVINGSKRRVRPELSQRVRDAARELNYFPNVQAQAMARGHSNVVGLIVPDIADPYFSSLAAGLILAAEDHKLVVNIACTLHRPERESDYVAALRGQRAHAAVLVGSRFANRRLTSDLAAELKSFEAVNGRIALISQARLPFDTVVVENTAGGSDLGEALCELGYRRFAILAASADLLTSRERIAGFCRGVASYGVEVDDADIFRGAFTRDGGYAATMDFLDSGRGAECIFAVNDVMALGAISALRDRGVAVPRDIAVAGFDDILPLQDTDPRLTTVRLPLHELGTAALDLIMSPRQAHPRLRRYCGEVVIRESTPARPRGLEPADKGAVALDGREGVDVVTVRWSG